MCGSWKIKEQKQHREARRGEWRLRVVECPEKAQLVP
jgi:hypothetical protein